MSVTVYLYPEGARSADKISPRMSLGARLKGTMQNRQHHQQEVLALLKNNFPSQTWEFALPKGSGNEIYFARSKMYAGFIKLGVQASK